MSDRRRQVSRNEKGRNGKNGGKNGDSRKCAIFWETTQFRLSPSSPGQFRLSPFRPISPAWRYTGRAEGTRVSS